MEYLNKKRLAKLIESTDKVGYWKQSLACKLLWNWKRNGESYVTLRMTWHFLLKTIAWIEEGKPEHLREGEEIVPNKPVYEAKLFR